jgi:hypothetical protein
LTISKKTNIDCVDIEECARRQALDHGGTKDHVVLHQAHKLLRGAVYERAPVALEVKKEAVFLVQAFLVKPVVLW